MALTFGQSRKFEVISRILLTDSNDYKRSAEHNQILQKKDKEHFCINGTHFVKYNHEIPYKA